MLMAKNKRIHKNDFYAHKNHIKINFYHFLSQPSQHAERWFAIDSKVLELKHTQCSQTAASSISILLPLFFFISFDCFSFFNISFNRYSRSSTSLEQREQYQYSASKDERVKPKWRWREKKRECRLFLEWNKLRHGNWFRATCYTVHTKFIYIFVLAHRLLN